LPAPPPDPLFDPERLARVVGTGLLDTPPEPAFDRLTHVACRALGAPVGYASLLTGDRQFIKSSGGLEDPCAPSRDLALTHTYCVEVVRSGRPLVISDARSAAAWRDHPVATELGLVSYLGVPLRTNAHVVGTLCVLDRVGREWRPGDVVLLEEVAAAMSNEILHRLEREQLRRVTEQERRLAAFAQRAIEGTPRVEELLLEAVGGVAAALRVDGCAVVERRGGDLVITAALGQRVVPGPIHPSPPLRAALARALGQPRRRSISIDAAGRAFALEEPVHTVGAVGAVGAAEGDGPEPFAAAALAPIGVGVPWGVLLGLSRAPRAFSAGDLELMGAFARLLGGAARRARVDDELRTAERRTRGLLDAASEGVCGLDRAGRLTFANAAAARLLGFRDVSELLGRPLESFVHAAPAGGATFRPPWVRAALAEGRPTHVEREVLRRADGLTFVAECRAAPLHGARQVDGAVVTFSDVTERTQTEAERLALLEAQRRAVEAAERASAELTALLGAAPIGIGLVDADLRYRRLNHALAELNGVAAEEHIGRRVRDLIPGPVGTNVEALLRRVIATGEPIRGVEVAHVAPDASREVRVVLGSAYPVTVEGRVQGIGIACFEVTHLKRHEEEQRLLAEASALLASFDFEANLRAVAALLVPRLAERCAIYLAERDGGLRRAADARAAPTPARPDPTRDALLLGLAREAQRSRRVVVSPPIEGHEAEPDPTVDPRVHVLEPEEARSLTLVGVSAIMLIPLARADEPAAGVLALWSGAKERRNAATGLRLAREVARRVVLALERTRLFREAQEATSSREHVLAVVSHDLRTPLTTILMSAARLNDLLEHTPGIAAGLARPLVLIQRAARTMKRLIDDLLDFAAIETGRLRIDTAPEEPARVVQEVVSSFQQMADAGRLVLFGDAAPGLPPIQADRERIEQVLSNVVSNALKVTPAGGTVAVRARRAGKFVQFSVTDTGPGLPRDQLQVIFERYWRGEGGGYQGVGLGLAIAKGIVEAHGGTIHAESEPGAGATFRFTVPIVGA
jgi:PAS domain S-box-containing protein